jgi:hypothetical protein
MTLVLIALYLASPPVDYPIGAKVAVFIAFGVDASIVRGAYVAIMSQLIQIRQALTHPHVHQDDDDE